GSSEEAPASVVTSRAGPPDSCEKPLEQKSKVRRKADRVNQELRDLCSAGHTERVAASTSPKEDPRNSRVILCDRSAMREHIARREPTLSSQPSKTGRSPSRPLTQ